MKCRKNRRCPHCGELIAIIRQLVTIVLITVTALVSGSSPGTRSDGPGYRIETVSNVPLTGGKAFRSARSVG